MYCLADIKRRWDGFGGANAGAGEGYEPSRLTWSPRAPARVRTQHVARAEVSSYQARMRSMLSPFMRRSA
jgi:hypothetical protein